MGTLCPHFCPLPTAPPLRPVTGTAHPHSPLIHNAVIPLDKDFSERRGRSITMVGTSFTQQQQDESGMRNQTQN